MGKVSGKNWSEKLVGNGIGGERSDDSNGWVVVNKRVETATRG